MSSQILVQGRLVGTEDFLLTAPADRDNRAFEARLTWLNQLGEVLPRALLATLQLPPLLLGSSGGGRFLAILPDRERLNQASEFLTRANAVLSDATTGLVRIVWSATENLGDWTVVRKRLSEGLRASLRPTVSAEGYFDPAPAPVSASDRIPRNLRDATSVAFSFDYPGAHRSLPKQMPIPQLSAGISAATPPPPVFPWRDTPPAMAIFPPLRRSWHCAPPAAKLWGVLRWRD